MWFRGLVAATCVAVLAAIGFYFWRDTQDRSLAAAHQADLRDAALTSECRQMLADLVGGQDRDLTLGHILVCIKGKYFSVADLRSSGMAPIADQVEKHITEFGLD